MKMFNQVCTTVTLMLVSSMSLGEVSTNDVVLATEKAEIKQQIATINGQVRSLPADSVIEQPACATLQCLLSDSGISYIMPTDGSYVRVFTKDDGLKACDVISNSDHRSVVKYDDVVLCQ